MATDQEKLDKKLLRAAGKGKVAEIEALLAAGAGINSRSGLFGKTPLSVAVWKGQTAAVKLLLEKGAEPDKREIGGFTPLLDVLYYKNARPEIVALLLAAGADPLATHGGKSALDIAREGKDPKVAKLVETAAAEKTARETALKEAAEKERAAAEKAAAEAERLKKLNLITLRQQIGDRTLEETYNFAARERITFVRRGPGQPVEAVTRQGFSDIAEAPGLREAFDEHRRLGGRTPESAVFPGALGKGRPLPCPPQAGGPDV